MSVTPFDDLLSAKAHFANLENVDFPVVPATNNGTSALGVTSNGRVVATINVEADGQVFVVR